MCDLYRRREEMSVMIGRCVIGLLCMMIISVSSGTVYVQSGSDITDCHMKCPEDDVTLELYRVCRGEERTLLENLCSFNATKSRDSRLRLDRDSGCWKLTPARKDDSCVYKIWCYDIPEYLISSTEIRVLDPVLIYNITSNGSRLGELVAVSIQFSGEESAVTWEVDGEPIPERYRLIDDNRTLIIPSVQRDDAKRRFRVRITNPVSEEIREYWLTNDPMFIKMMETEDYGKTLWISVAVLVLVLVAAAATVQIYIKWRKCRKCQDSSSSYSYTGVSMAREVHNYTNKSSCVYWHWFYSRLGVDSITNLYFPWLQIELE
ncbi:uncharacterized protein LOC143981648 isoform X2 [Lithobates pipiens]